MRKAIFVLSIVLAGAIIIKAQPTTSIQFGSTTELLNTTSVGVVNGTAYALPTGAASALTWQLDPIGGPSAINAGIQTSLDGSAWQNISNSTSTTGVIVNLGVGSWKYIRGAATSRTGGTSTRIIISVLRAFQTSSSGVSNIANARIGVPGSLGGAPGIYATADTASGFYNFSGGGGQEWAVSFLGSAKMSWGVNGTSNYGPHLWPSDNTHDVGTATSRPKIIFVGTGLQYGATAFASLGTPTNGSIRYCNDCTIASPCAGAGTGALAKRLNGIWVCN